MWSRTNTLKITLELVRNAGETLVQTYSLGMRSGSVPRVLQKPHESRPENEARTGSAAHATHDMVSGQQPSARMELVKGLAHSTRPYIRDWRGWWCRGNRGDRPARVLASPGGQYRTCPFWNKGCWALGSERTGVPWGCSLSQQPPGHSDPEQSPPLG